MRRDLPTRRHCTNIRVTWRDFKFHISIGFDNECKPLEVFYSDGIKSGQDLRATIVDACIAISLALQYGCPPSDLTKSMNRDVHTLDVPASVIGVIAEAVASEALRLKSLQRHT